MIPSTLVFLKILTYPLRPEINLLVAALLRRLRRLVSPNLLSVNHVLV